MAHSISSLIYKVQKGDSHPTIRIPSSWSGIKNKDFNRDVFEIYYEDIIGHANRIADLDKLTGIVLFGSTINKPKFSIKKKGIFFKRLVLKESYKIPNDVDILLIFRDGTNITNPNAKLDLRYRAGSFDEYGMYWEDRDKQDSLDILATTESTLQNNFFGGKSTAHHIVKQGLLLAGFWPNYLKQHNECCYVGEMNGSSMNTTVHIDHDWINVYKKYIKKNKNILDIEIMEAVLNKYTTFKDPACIVPIKEYVRYYE